ncbi:MAG: YihY/virulence factor BrkB family protein [Bacteroidales bacterium]
MNNSKRRGAFNRGRRRLTLLTMLAARKAKRVSIIGFKGVPLYEVLRFFFKGIVNGSITTRASAVAFDFFVAIFPTIIFVFTLLPYVPVENFQEQLLDLIEGIIPNTAYKLVESTLVDVVSQRNWGLLSFGFIAAVIFAHNGMSALINAFNATYHTIETRKFVNQHLIAFFLTFLLPSLVTIAVILLVFGKFGLGLLVEKDILQLNLTYYLFDILRWVVIVWMFLFSISFLYYLAPAKRTEFKFISPGSIMATFMILVTSLGFSFFVNNFGQYNKLYGSIGSLLALMIWIFFNAIGLIVGFELNASIASARNKRKIDELKIQLSNEQEENIGTKEGIQSQETHGNRNIF